MKEVERSRQHKLNFFEKKNSLISPGNIGCSENCWGHADATQVSGQQQRPRSSSRSTKGKPPERYEPGPPSKPTMHKVSSKLPDAVLTLTWLNSYRRFFFFSIFILLFHFHFSFLFLLFIVFFN